MVGEYSPRHNITWHPLVTSNTLSQYALVNCIHRTRGPGTCRDLSSIYVGSYCNNIPGTAGILAGTKKKIPANFQASFSGSWLQLTSACWPVINPLNPELFGTVDTVTLSYIDTIRAEHLHIVHIVYMRVLLAFRVQRVNKILITNTDKSNISNPLTVRRVLTRAQQHPTPLTTQAITVKYIYINTETVKWSV